MERRGGVWGVGDTGGLRLGGLPAGEGVGVPAKGAGVAGAFVDGELVFPVYAALPDGAESGAGDAVGGTGSAVEGGVEAGGGDVAGVDVDGGVGGDSADGGSQLVAIDLATIDRENADCFGSAVG